LTGQVENRADVLVNFADGYYSGSALMDVFAFLLATHGNLGRGQSLAFVIDTHRDLPPYVRAQTYGPPSARPVLKKSKPLPIPLAAKPAAEKPGP